MPYEHRLWESQVVVASVENSTTSTTATILLVLGLLSLSIKLRLFNNFYPMRIVGLVLLAFTILFVSFMIIEAADTHM